MTLCCHRQPRNLNRLQRGRNTVIIRLMQEQATKTAAEKVEMSRTPLAFLSYVNLDDQHEQGRLTQFRERLSGEVRMQTGEPFDIFQDKKDIALGQPWEERINDSLDATTFLLPIITPAFFKSTACRAELERFLKREKELGRSDLILPVYYVTCPVLSDKAKLELDPLAKIIAARQYVDWRPLRFKPFDSEQVCETLAKMAQQIVAALERSHSVTNIQQHEPKPAPAAKTEPPTVVVDQRGNGDYTTITEALKAVKAGTRILVRPGLYKEGIVIDKPVEIIGDGERSEIVIQSDGKAVVLFKADNGRIANLTLRQTDEEYACAVELANGRLELEECDISNQGLVCVAIYDYADPRLRRNRIHDGSCGVFVFKDGKGTLEDNEIFANARFGVVILTGGKPTLRRNRISKNGDVGIKVMNGAGGIFEDNEIFANAGGVQISEGGNPTLRRNSISKNDWQGIWVDSGGGGIFEDNDLRGNASGAWFIEDGCEARVQRSGNKE
ncbi:right-handed parallel beta-helix repeat-containing protein [Desulfobulbus sp. F5]|nr:right-handed parallel beta-helix repeat-containing protein [Desulfobulbus sp. F5]